MWIKEKLRVNVQLTTVTMSHSACGENMMDLGPSVPSAKRLNMENTSFRDTNCVTPVV